MSRHSATRAAPARWAAERDARAQRHQGRLVSGTRRDGSTTVAPRRIMMDPLATLVRRLVNEQLRPADQLDPATEMRVLALLAEQPDRCADGKYGMSVQNIRRVLDAAGLVVTDRQARPYREYELLRRMRGDRYDGTSRGIIHVDYRDGTSETRWIGGAARDGEVR